MHLHSHANSFMLLDRRPFFTRTLRSVFSFLGLLLFSLFRSHGDDL